MAMQLAVDFNRPSDYTVHLPTRVDEFWTSKQRAGHSLHEVSYRACYKPQLPEYFVKEFCKTEAVVYDPFMGRGTTLIEAQLHGHRVFGNDINPLAQILTAPRLNPPTLEQIEARLHDIHLSTDAEVDTELLVFFHEDTLREIYGWRTYFQQERFDSVDAWLQMVACSRLTGHSTGFFSVFTLPPNLATSIVAQRKINEKRNQVPEYRNTKELILRKSKQLLRHSLPDCFRGDDAILLTESADNTPQIVDASVDLVVTSPPFLDTIDYMQDNWLRMWFCGIKIEQGKIWQLKSLEDWVARMTDVLAELYRVLKRGGRIAFEVGEVRNGTVFLENAVVKASLDVGLVPEMLMINAQHFTKTANCWGVSNNKKGTNSNRIVILKKG
ncbi:site-specific DNA-methyltransferase [Candidatus Poribacteria bacterium]|nr:site-specific DNA-methyltransferase [Candidatus Poribacteria bacterium]MYA55107.1 site-specific DNA-methyltransferase [Candidatus Poribacteria bacterium]